MATYSMEEAMTKLPEILEKVREGERVILTDNGKEVAEVMPVRSMEQVLQDLEDEGIISPPTEPRRDLSEIFPIAKRPGALARFLESRR
ncbi:MAG TPA: type II toxin-antitoxin system prevent-host-death family antitoxin [Thermoanaerobaculia bacterium]